MLLYLFTIPFLTAVEARSAVSGTTDTYRYFGYFSRSEQMTVNLTTPIDERSVCTSQECLDFADRIWTNMNTSIDPCEDFYEYACGRWSENNPLPEGMSSWDMQSIVQDQIERQIKGILKTKVLPGDVRSVRLAKKWYTACVNTEDIEGRGLEPLLSILAASGGWPMIMGSGERSASKYDWQRVDDYYANLTASNGFHEIRVAAYGVNATEESAVLDVPNLPSVTWILPNEANEIDEGMNGTTEGGTQENLERIEIERNGTYATFVLNVSIAIADAAGFNVSRDELLDEIIDMLAFQIKMQKLTIRLDDYVNMTLDNFQMFSDDLMSNRNEPKINWVGKIKDMFNRAGVEVDTDLKMKITSLNYFKDVIRLIEHTPHRTIVNYLHWKFVSNVIAKTTKDMRTMFNNLSSHDSDGGQEETPEARSDACLGEAQMADVFAYAYVQKYYSDDITSAALNMMEDIEQQIELQIIESSWSNDAIKHRVLKKLRAIKKIVGYPDFYTNKTIMENYLGNLELGSTYFENAISYQRYTALSSLRKLNGEKDVKTWFVDPATINAFYLSADNSITVPAANFRLPYFSFHQPNTINYGLIGFLLSHELNHAFDQSRHEFAENGTTVEWPRDMSDAYKRSINCFVEQFDNYSKTLFANDSIKDYGERTLDENMADTMGLKAAYGAYLRRERKRGRIEDGLPTLENFGNDQLFFLSFANLWCETIKPDLEQFLPLVDLHGTNRLRVIGSLSNSKDFARAFNCSVDSPMNPQKKCSIWN